MNLASPVDNEPTMFALPHHHDGSPQLTETMPPQRLFFSLQGRVNRRTFWLYGVLALLALGMVGMALLEIAGMQPARAERWVNLLIAWPAVAISVKRWHDRDKSGWWVLVALIPLVGQLWMLIANGLLRGTSGPNRFGDEPPPRA
jgi:uncharacterized membrane protein YhaH (DUF805 family)